MRKERELESIIADKDRTIARQQRVIRHDAGDHTYCTYDVLQSAAAES